MINDGFSFKAIQISQYLGMPPPAISRILNSLEHKGLIVREINTDNRRSVTINLTKKGREIYNICKKMSMISCVSSIYINAKKIALFYLRLQCKLEQRISKKKIALFYLSYFNASWNKGYQK